MNGGTLKSGWLEDINFSSADDRFPGLALALSGKESTGAVQLHPRGQAMSKTGQNTMQAVAMDRFGGVETLSLRTLPVPEIGPDEVLIRVESAGVGVWDPFEREGGFARMFGVEPKFPYVLGSDGAGTIAAVGSEVRGFREGDRVYASSFLNPPWGFYAEFAAVKVSASAMPWPAAVSLIPGNLTTEQAGALPVCAITALRGLDSTLGLQQGEAVMIFGAGGGIGHLAVQLAKGLGARVFAVASGDDGVALAKRLGADAAVNGRRDDVVAAAREFAPGGLDAALLTAGGETTQHALAAIRTGGRLAYPHGVEPEPQGRAGIVAKSYDGMPDPELIAKLNRLIESGPFEVHIARVFPLGEAAAAHRALATHYLGKLALRPATGGQR
jgi:NADPH:quinone reductase